MLLLALLNSAWALRCTNTGYFPDRDAGEVPRNVRWLPIQGSGGPYRLEPAPKRPAHVNVEEDLAIFSLRGPTLPANTPFRVLMSAWDGMPLTGAMFHTSERVDHTRPVGGRLLGAVWGDMTGLVLVTEPVTDDTRVLAIVESWSASAPDDRRRSIAWTGVSSEDPAFRSVEAADLGKRASHAVATAMGSTPFYVLLEDDVAKCAGPPSGFRRASAGSGAALFVRTRWMDLAGNTTPWSRTVEISSATIDARGWAAVR